MAGHTGEPAGPNMRSYVQICNILKVALSQKSSAQPVAGFYEKDLTQLAPQQR